MDSRWQALMLNGRRKALLAIFILVILGTSSLYWSELLANDRLSAIVSRPSSFLSSMTSDKLVIQKKVAVIIENRPSGRLAPLILHFSSVLGPEWPILLFTKLSLSNISDSAPFNAGLTSGKFAIRALPGDVEFSSHKAVSRFLTLPWFWEQLAPADHVLLFQADSIICANAPQRVDDYLQYDMIGAPIANGMGQGYNGGLSLRNRNKMLEIVRKHDWLEAWEIAQRRKAEENERARIYNEQMAKEAKEKEEAESSKENGGKEIEEHSKEPENTDAESQKRKTKRQAEIGPMPHTYVFPDNPTPPWEDYEDQWFFKRLTEMPGVNLPRLDVAKTFSVETVEYERPLGYHQVGLILTDNIDEVEAWCPEYHLSTDKRFKSAD